MKSRINITEIAQQAGVSIATVSRVLNTPSLVKESTRQRVLDILKSTNYKINAIAKNLRTKKSYSIGLIYTSVLMMFYNMISKGVEDVAIGKNYNVFFCNSGDDPLKEADYLSLLYEKRVDGIIVAPTGNNRELFENIISYGIPVCFIDRIVKGINTDSVTVNNRESSCNAVSYMIEKGYRRIGFISGPRRTWTGIERFSGYFDAHKAHNIEFQEELVRFGDFQFDSGYRGAKELIEKGNIDALYIANEPMAAGALELLNEKNIRFPEDIGFLMWDNPYWSTLLKPQISVVSQPMYTIGTTASELLFKRITAAEAYMDKEPLKITLNTELVIRGST
jgi:LacI family transcriptional regulator